MAVVDNGTPQFGANSTDPSSGVITKRAGAAKADDFALVVNGGSPETGSSGTMPTVSQFNLGMLIPENASQRLNGHLRKIAYWPKRLSNTLLQDITT
jgi:hypothetical protein